MNGLKRRILLACLYTLVCVGYDSFVGKIDANFNMSTIAIISILMLGLLVLGAILSTVITILALVFSLFIEMIKRYKRSILTFCILFWVFTLPLIVSVKFFSWHYARQTYDGGNILINALERYKNGSGRYPSDITLLVPEYISSVLKTAKGNNFNYEAVGDTNTLYVYGDFGRLQYHKDLKNWIWHD